MTINGIWTWASTLAQEIPASGLRNKTLAIDGHIWIYESLKGCETHHQSNPNSFLVTFYNRIQRLRELKVTPIVVFDNIAANSSSGIDQDAFVPRKRRSVGGTHFTNLEDHVFKANTLLSHLGIQVIISYGDGEAQCAHLESLGLTSGCITSDFDYFLFGGTNLYRFDFNGGSNSVVTHLSMGRMSVEKKVTRSHLISTAILLGCDYYQQGVVGVGISAVFDILAEFGDEDRFDVDPHVILDRFVSYVRGEVPARSEDSERKLRLRRKKYNFLREFPNSMAVENAIRMYMSPAVSQPTSISPKPANIPKVEQLLMNECGWSEQKMRKNVMTSMKRTRENANMVMQTRIPEFFSTTRKRNLAAAITEPCTSLDEYILANNQWVSKRKSESPPSKTTRKSRNIAQERLRSDRIFTRHKESDDVIDLDSD